MKSQKYITIYGKNAWSANTKKRERLRGRTRAQMRTVDFALTLLVFVILLTYLVLTISGTINTAFYETRKRNQEINAYNTALQIIENTGTPGLWNQDLEKFPDIFGLASSGKNQIGTELEVGKIARIDPSLESTELKKRYPYFYVPYSFVRSQLVSMPPDYHFSIEIAGIIDVEIETTLNGANLELNTIVKTRNMTQNDSTVFIYVLDPRGELLDYSENITNKNGLTAVRQVDLPQPGVYVAVAIANKNVGYAYDYQIINYNAISEFNVVSFVQPLPQTNSGEILQYLAIEPDIVRTTNATVIYTGGTVESVPLEGQGRLQRGKMALREGEPQIIITRAQVQLNRNIAYGLGVTAIPLILGDDHRSAYRLLNDEDNPFLESDPRFVMNRLVVVQRIPMIIIIKLWN